MQIVPGEEFGRPWMVCHRFNEFRTLHEQVSSTQKRPNQGISGGWLGRSTWPPTKGSKERGAEEREPC